ncbi:MAG: hypothetical protein MJH10_12000 [Epibacterium sp.]|nr:hypothetical protein [Epibacterium sp.]NQX74269.1 hypothetical protein [Epibacterium sp.]
MTQRPDSETGDNLGGLGQERVETAGFLPLIGVMGQIPMVPIGDMRKAGYQGMKRSGPERALGADRMDPLRPV